MMDQLGAGIRVVSRERPRLLLRNWQSFVLVMVAMFFGTIHQSSLGRQVDSSSHLAALGISLLLALAFMRLNLYILKTGGHRALPELLPMIMPRGLAACLLIVFALGQVLYAGLAVHYQSEGIAAFMLEKTPFDVVVMALLLTAALLLQRGLRQLARVSELLFWLILIPLIAVFAMASMQMDWGEIRTLTAVNGHELGDELRETIPLIFNLHLLLFMEGTPAKQGRKGLWLGTVVTMSTQLLFFIILVGVFTLAGTAQLHLPIAELIRVTNAAPYSLIERMDVFFLAARTILVVLNLGLWLYAACRSLQGAFSLSGIRMLLPVMAILAFCVSLLGKEIELLAWLQRAAGMLQWILCIGFVPAIALAVFIRSKREMLP